MIYFLNLLIQAQKLQTKTKLTARSKLKLQKSQILSVSPKSIKKDENNQDLREIENQLIDQDPLNLNKETNQASQINFYQNEKEQEGDQDLSKFLNFGNEKDKLSQSIAEEQQMNDAPLRLNTIDPLQITNLNAFNDNSEVSSPEKQKKTKNQKKFNYPQVKENMTLHTQQNLIEDDQTNNRPREGMDKAKATEVYSRAEKEIRKYDISIDQFKQKQWVKNPIPGWNLILIAVTYLLLTGLVLPFSIAAVETNSCNLELHPSPHLFFLLLSLISLIPTDIYGYLQHKKILSILQAPSNNPLLPAIVPNQADDVTFCFITGQVTVLILNLVCSICTIYEIYSDVLIAAVSLVNSLPSTFGFFAVVIPILNTLVHLYASIKLFGQGLKKRVKTIGTDKIDKLLLYLGLYNMSRLIFPMFNEHKPRFLTIIIIKECAFKLLQIILKLVLITPTLAEDCSGNISTLSFMIMANLISALQIVFYITQKYPKKQEEVEYQNLNELNEYYNPTNQSFSVVIINTNQERVMKKLNAFLFQPAFLTRTVCISFKNLSQLLQPKYRINLFQLLASYQQFNFKLRNLKIFQSELNSQDFSLLSQIVSQIPKLESLSLESVVLTDDECECLKNLKPGIEKNKNFKYLKLQWQTKVGKKRLFEEFSSLYNLNQQLSIEYINGFFELNQIQRRDIKYRSPFEQSQQQEVSIEISMQQIAHVHAEQALYDELDLEFFVSCRKSDKNHKLFVFREWENLLRRLYLVKSKNLLLCELPSFPQKKVSDNFIQQSEIFIYWIQYLIQKNPQLTTLGFNLIPSNQEQVFEKSDMAKFFMRLSQAQTIVEEILENESNNIQVLRLKSFGKVYQLESFFDKVIQLKFIQEIKLHDIDLSNLDIFKILSNLPQLKSLIMIETCLTSLNGIEQLQNLILLTVQKHKIRITNQKTLLFINTLEFVDISYILQQEHTQTLFDIENLIIHEYQSVQDEQQWYNKNDEENQAEKIYNEKLKKSDAIKQLKLGHCMILDDEFCRFILEMCYQQTHLARINLEGNLLTDLCLPFILKYLTCRKQPLEILNLSSNRFTAKSRRLIALNRIQSLLISDNLIEIQTFFASIQPQTDKDQENILISLQVNSQKQNSNQSEKQVLRPYVAYIQDPNMILPLKTFKQMRSLELGYLGLSEFSVLIIIQQIEIGKIPVEHLDLSGNNVGISGCKSLNLLIQRNKNLKNLMLDNAKIKCLGLSYLWIGLSDLDDDLSLDQLSVRKNGIDIQWAKRLNYKLCQPIKVKKINLSENFLTDRASKEFLMYFESNKHVESLNLSLNGMTREGLRQLSELLYRNAYIKEIIVKGNLDIEESIYLCERRARASETNQKMIYF